MQTSFISFVIILSTLGFGSQPNSRETAGPVLLKSRGRLVFKDEKQSFGKDCTATREWFEVAGRPDTKMQNKVNRAIRREITVGQKLDKKSCGESGGLYYSNQVSLTANRRNAIGVETAINFDAEGGTGTHLHTCAIYDLKNGTRYDLESYLSDAGKSAIAAQICEDAKKSGDNVENSCGGFQQIKDHLYYKFRFCLKDAGLAVRFGTANSVAGSVELTEDQVKSAFTLPSSLDLTE